MTGNTMVGQSVWAPLRQPVFRMLWAASMVACLGGWMQDVAAAWLMTSLAPSPIMVSLLQTATYLPFFLLSLPAGALADVVDRRLLLLSSQFWMFFSVIGLGLLTLSGVMTPWLLLTVILIVGIGAAMNAPAWNALAPDLVPRTQLEAAIALGAAGFNLSRGLGAALGGLLVAAAGPGWVFLLNAFSMLFILLAVYRWKREPGQPAGPSENVMGAMKAGLRYTRHSPAIQSVLARTAIFVASASAVWALLPLLARRDFHLCAIEYGLLLSVFGVGTLAGAAAVPWLRQRISLNWLAGCGTLLFATSSIALAFVRDFAPAMAAMFTAGLGWITACAALNASLLMAAPSWVRARAVAIYLLVFQGCLAIGSLFWGVIANWLGMPCALLLSAGGLLIGMALSPRYNLAVCEKLDVQASAYCPDPVVSLEPHRDHGPIQVNIEYLIDEGQSLEFTRAVTALETHRRRDGAVQWHLFCDLSHPRRYVETFLVETWGEYLRQRQRATKADRAAEEKVFSFHIGDEAPRITHLIAERRRSNHKGNTQPD